MFLLKDLIIFIILKLGPDLWLQNIETHPDFSGVLKDEATCRSGSTLKCCAQAAWRKVEVPQSPETACFKASYLETRLGLLSNGQVCLRK